MARRSQKLLRETIREGFKLINNVGHENIFIRMYSHNNLDKSLRDVIDGLPNDKLDWATAQVVNSVNKIYPPLNEKEVLIQLDILESRGYQKYIVEWKNYDDAVDEYLYGH